MLRRASFTQLCCSAIESRGQQWEILRTLTAEFAAGEGARGLTRTRFAVGDPKQSIYSFQGADPREFELTRRAWGRAAEGAGHDFADVSLRLSFRTASHVLAAVDAVFGVPEHFAFWNAAWPALPASSRTRFNSAPPSTPRRRLLAEHEVTKLVTMVSAITERMGIETPADPEVGELSQDVAPDAVLDEIERNGRA